jgi:hypothetical protein
VNRLRARSRAPASVICALEGPPSRTRRRIRLDSRTTLRGSRVAVVPGVGSALTAIEALIASRLSGIPDTARRCSSAVNTAPDGPTSRHGRPIEDSHRHVPEARATARARPTPHAGRRPPGGRAQAKGQARPGASRAPASPSEAPPGPRHDPCPPRHCLPARLSRLSRAPTSAFCREGTPGGANRSLLDSARPHPSSGRSRGRGRARARDEGIRGAGGSPPEPDRRAQWSGDRRSISRSISVHAHRDASGTRICLAERGQARAR